MKIVTRPKVNLVWSTPDPRKVVAIAARMTRSAMNIEDLTENITADEVSSSIRAILESHHLSVLRHVSYCFTVSGVSRAFSHQLVRHTAGHAYEQRSQHYRKEKNPSFIQSDSIGRASPAEYTYEHSLERSEEAYNNLVTNGVPKEDARMVLPNATETQLIWTANLEAILNFVQARACRVNCSEILDVAIQVRKIVIDTFPEMASYLGPSCWTRGICYEGKKFYSTCLRPWKQCVLWSPHFPETIELIGIGGKVGHIVPGVSKEETS